MLLGVVSGVWWPVRASRATPESTTKGGGEIFCSMDERPSMFKSQSGHGVKKITPLTLISDWLGAV